VTVQEDHISRVLQRQAAVVEAARDILRDADHWGLHTPRLEALRAALAALDVEHAP
jgi:hypothetical protein